MSKIKLKYLKMSVLEETHLNELQEVNKKEEKKKLFDKEFRALVRQSQEIITAKYGASIEFGNTRSELICLNKYLSIYGNMDASEHYRYFETLFGQKRRSILNTIQDSSWTRDDGMIIQFGQGTNIPKELIQKFKQTRIMLSDIFSIAYDLQEIAEQNIDDLGKDFSNGSKDLIRPRIILLHLMRIFYHLNDGSDKEQLGKIVNNLEEELGATKTVGVTTLQKRTSDVETNGQVGGLSGLFSMATNMMQKMGISTPDGMEAPSEKEISNVINKVFNNEGTQTVIQQVLSSLKGCDDIGSALQAAVKTVADPGTMKNIQETITKGFNEAKPEGKTFHSE
jgi:hypothetical protein